MYARTWTRTDQVLLEGALWALPGIAALQVVLHGVRWLRGDALEVDGVLPDDLVRGADVVTGPVSGTVVVEEPSAAQHAWALAVLVVLLVLAVVVARLLLGVTRSLRTGDPFTTANARRLATLGIVIVVGGTLVQFLQGIAFEAVLDPLLPEDGPRTWTLDLAVWPVLTGVLMFFLAEVFARGARLREDVEGLV